MKILETNKAIDDAIEFMCDPETGELKSEEEILEICEKLEMERDEKIKYLCNVVVNTSAEADALREHKKSIDARIKTADRKVESLKHFIRYALNGEKFKNAEVSVSYRTTKDKVFVDDIETVPDEFFKTPHTESNLSKTSVKEAIQNGQPVPGCHLEDSVSTIIK